MTDQVTAGVRHPDQPLGIYDTVTDLLLTAAQESVAAATARGATTEEMAQHTTNANLAGLVAYVMAALAQVHPRRADFLAVEVEDFIRDGEPLAEWVAAQLTARGVDVDALNATVQEGAGLVDLTAALTVNQYDQTQLHHAAAPAVRLLMLGLTAQVFPGVDETVPWAGRVHRRVPLAELATAAAVRQQAMHQVDRAVIMAREDGHSWSAIGQAMNLHDDPTSAAMLAWTYATTGKLPAQRVDRLVWKCSACREMVTESDPHPDRPLAAAWRIQMDGHRPGCRNNL